jgi:hypothetical protein
LRFFPGRDEARAAVAEILVEICLNEDEVDRLVAAVLKRFDVWPGPAKLRELHTSEIVPLRPREVRPEGCAKCRGMGGLRLVFTTYESLPGGGEKKQVHYPEGSIVLFEQKLYRYCAESGASGPYSVVIPCDCELGQF